MCAQNVVLSEFRIKLHLGQDIYSILTLYRDIIPTIKWGLVYYVHFYKKYLSQNESESFFYKTKSSKTEICDNLGNFFSTTVILTIFSTDILGINKLHWWCVGWNAWEEFRSYSKSLLWCRKKGMMFNR